MIKLKITKLVVVEGFGQGIILHLGTKIKVLNLKKERKKDYKKNFKKRKE